MHDLMCPAPDLHAVLDVDSQKHQAGAVYITARNAHSCLHNIAQWYAFIDSLDSQL